MAEVSDHLVPTDGLTNSHVRLAGIDTQPHSNGVVVRFDIRDEDDGYIGTLRIPVDPTSKTTVDALIVDAHKILTNMLRQWLFETDKMRQHYGTRGAP